MLKFISENKVNIFSKNNQNLLTFFCCAFIFLLSIYLRSTLDISGDSGVYLDLVEKISRGKKYYFDFFEGNFPLSFYLYLIPFYFAKITNINFIITAEVFVNLIGLSAILFSRYILRNSTLKMSDQNLLIVGFMLGFFLRPDNLAVNEFITKTTFFLTFSFIYIAFSFPQKKELSKKMIICRGLFAGLLPCLKPHYIILPLVIELHRFWQKKSLKFFLEIDKLVMLMIGILYLIFLYEITPEFLRHIVSSWSSIHYPYSNNNFLFNSINLNYFTFWIFFYGAIFTIFLHKKLSNHDLILLLVFISASLIFFAELLGSVDQRACFTGIITPIILTLCRNFDLRYKKILLLPVIAVIAPQDIMHIKQFVVFWWFLIPLISIFLALKLYKNWQLRISRSHLIIGSVTLLSLYFIAIVIYKYPYGYVFFSMTVFLLFIIFYEKIYKNFYHKPSLLLIFTQFFVASYLLAFYLSVIGMCFTGKDANKSPNIITSTIIQYGKSLKKDENILIISELISHTFPVLNYLSQPNIYVGNTTGPLFWAIGNDFSNLRNQQEAHKTIDYLFSDLKRSLSDKQTKIIFINNAPVFTNHLEACKINFLEYYLQDKEFRKIFLQNFRFENRIFYRERQQKIFYDFEIYVRKNDQ